MRTTTAIITGIIRLSGEELTGVQATKAETRQQAFLIFGAAATAAVTRSATASAS